MEKLKTALAYGADAVYAGVPAFSLRARTNSFDIAGLKEAVSACHDAGKKLYVTLNVFAHNRHLEKLPAHLKELRAIGVDAVILSDPGILRLVKEMWPDCLVHLSTQANCTNWSAVKFWQEAGVKRVILARELSKEEISDISSQCGVVDFEYFVHGAMCLAYSGRCFLSRYYTGRSANLGDCAQPCRWRYRIQEETRPDDALSAEEDGSGTYIFNTRDLCLLENLSDLHEAGVRHFKIEGRTKSIYYAAMVTGIYRQAIDMQFSHEKEEVKREKIAFLARELRDKLTNRGYSTGFLFGEPQEPDRFARQSEPAWEICGQVEEGCKAGGLARVKVHNTLRASDETELVLPPYTPVNIKLSGLYDARDNSKLQEAHGGQGKSVMLKTGVDTPACSILRRKLS